MKGSVKGSYEPLNLKSNIPCATDLLPKALEELNEQIKKEGFYPG